MGKEDISDKNDEIWWDSLDAQQRQKLNDLQAKYRDFIDSLTKDQQEQS